jgi:hypothetical protein
MMVRKVKTSYGFRSQKIASVVPQTWQTDFSPVILLKLANCAPHPKHKTQHHAKPTPNHPIPP